MLENENENLLRELFVEDFDARDSILAENRTFAYYTSAETALKILRSQSVWMRNAASLNDYSEIHHGLLSLRDALLGEPGHRLSQSLNSIHSDIYPEIMNGLSEWQFLLQYETYVTCVSSHDRKEDLNGRLSMWRAYGKGSGVALVFNGKPFTVDADVLSLNSHPVIYGGGSDIGNSLKHLATRIDERNSRIKACSMKDFRVWLHGYLVSIIVCTKHPGFSEESEWRIMHIPARGSSDHLTREIQCIGGIPQPIYRIPLDGKGAIDISIPSLLDRVIIGPTPYPIPIYHALCDTLTECGVKEAAKKIFISRIPLRPS